MNELPKAGAGELADIITMEESGWTVVVFGPGQIEIGLSRVRVETELILSEENATATVRLVQAPSAAGDLITQLAIGQPTDVTILRGIEHLSVRELEALDSLRNVLIASPRILVATDHDGAAGLAVHSPNLWSWVGARSFAYSPDEGKMNTAVRLQSLRDHFAMTDEQVIECAQAGTLPSDPAYIEWLVLLNRGDLIGR
jgi:hypothetical protein